MQSEGIISTRITRDILEKGHQTIRLRADGFSLLVSDASFRPILLSAHASESAMDISTFPEECLRILEDQGLSDFNGETSIILDTGAAALVPSSLYDEASAGSLLTSTRLVSEEETVESRYVRSRDLYIIQGIPSDILELKGRLKGEVHILHPLECMLSLSDQIQASDHQRGFLLAEVQKSSMSLLAVREDRVILLNRFDLNDPSDFIYHVLNSLRQLDLDRESIPVYLSGIIHDKHELRGLVKKYVRKIKDTPYYLEALSREDISRFMLLSEASKCA